MFEEFVRKLTYEISRELPGFSAQKMMAPLGRRPPLDYLKEGAVPKNSAVLVLLYPFAIENSLTINTVLIVRSDNEGGMHGGQVAFPGGRMDDSDKDLAATALREAEEEIGIEPGSVAIIGELTPLYIPVSNYMVHPFVGTVSKHPIFKIHSAEVKGVLEVPVRDLASDTNKGIAKRFVKFRGEEIDVPCFKIKEEIIWGATAMIISEFTEIIRRI